jgi:hypothetical protein
MHACIESVCMYAFLPSHSVEESQHVSHMCWNAEVTATRAIPAVPAYCGCQPRNGRELEKRHTCTVTVVRLINEFQEKKCW